VLFLRPSQGCIPSPKARWIRLALGFGVGIVLCGMVSNALNQPDPACIVLDEIIAFLMVLCVTPRCWQWRTIAFLIFRWFDIIKPIPINWIDTVIPGGFGIMLDDGVAAGYTIMILLLAKRLRQASR